MSNDTVGQVIAIGGGGFGRSIHNTLIDQYILKQSSSDKPNVCFIPTASAEDKAYTVSFYSVYSKLNCNPTHLNLFQRTPRLDSLINKQDVIFVGGGNTKSMMAVWREWQLDKLLLKAYNRGAILCGVSAGAICWFKEGITDSWASNLNIMDCLGFIPECCCHHYDGEEDRRPSVHNFIESGKLSSCIAIEDGAAVHFKDNKLLTSVSFYKDKKSYLIKTTDQGIKEQEIDSIQLP